MSSSQAGPSTAKPTKASKKSKQPVTATLTSHPELSKETISDDESEASSVVSADSEDLEAVTPKKRVDGHVPGTARAAGKLP
jgi:hypothetical protein